MMQSHYTTYYFTLLFSFAVYWIQIAQSSLISSVGCSTVSSLLVLTKVVNVYLAGALITYILQ